MAIAVTVAWAIVSHRNVVSWWWNCSDM